MDKIEDFGAHANAYYPLKIEIFKTQTDEKLLDLLWNKYWVATLSQSNILSVSVHFCWQTLFMLTPQNRSYGTSQLKDLNAKLASAANKLSESSADLKLRSLPPSSKEDKPKKGGSHFAGVEMEASALTAPSKDG